MSDLACYGCAQKEEEQKQEKKEEETSGDVPGYISQIKTEESTPMLGSTNEVKAQSEPYPLLYLKCICCNQIYCSSCCQKHLSSSLNSPQVILQQNEKTELGRVQATNQQQLLNKIKAQIYIICQECEDGKTVKYCQNCEQYLCEKCSFKIHNKGKRAKHSLEEDIVRNLMVRKVVVVGNNVENYLKAVGEEGKSAVQIFQNVLQSQSVSSSDNLLLLQENGVKILEGLSSQKWKTEDYDIKTIKYEDLVVMTSKYPFFSSCKLFIMSQDSSFHKSMLEEHSQRKVKLFSIDVYDEWKKIQVHRKHERVLSEQVTLKHNKNVSNFSNVSAASKIEHQSLISNDQSDLYQSNQLSLNLNNSSGILMMGTYSDHDKQEKEQKRHQNQRQKNEFMQPGHHRIYSIRQQNSHTSRNSGNNMSTSTENSIRKRTKKWPIPYFQPYRIPKYQRSSKHKAESYLRELSEKGILMIRKQKAEDYLIDQEVSRLFVRNIGEKQIQYVAYIIDFLSVECLTWVIESVKEDKMTPNQKLIQSRLKESFDLKVNMKLWDSIVKYLQSPQYDQDYFDNTPSRFVPKINVVKYGDQFLLQFDERKWAYEDQQLLDEQQEQWKQFKQLITDYFNDHNQITGGRYGCVQYVKLNGPKPLRKCSLGKLSLYVQEAINKGIIRYHKTLLVSNSEIHSNSVCSQLGSLDQSARWAQIQKELKVMALQLALVDMFLEVPPSTQISLAQIPLNMKKNIIFDYTLVELGFPKLKNLLNTLADKLLLQSTKTHISYELTTNGSEAIEKMRKNTFDINQNFLTHILGQINTIMLHYPSLTLDDLYSQLANHLGFTFQHKLFRFPDFYSFVLYYCANIATVQYVGSVLVVYSKYAPPYPIYNSQNQTHRSTYSQQQFPTHNNHLFHSMQVSKTTLKKKVQTGRELFVQQYRAQVPSLNMEQIESIRSINTPELNGHPILGRARLNSDGWASYLEEDHTYEEKGEDADENHSRQIEHIINIIDDGEASASRPKTVIVNEGTEQQQFFLLPKLENHVDQLQSLGAEGVVWAEEEGMPPSNKIQHTRFKSTNQPPVKHSRQYSTNTRK